MQRQEQQLRTQLPQQNSYFTYQDAQRYVNQGYFANSQEPQSVPQQYQQPQNGWVVPPTFYEEEQLVAQKQKFDEYDVESRDSALENPMFFQPPGYGNKLDLYGNQVPDSASTGARVSNSPKLFPIQKPAEPFEDSPLDYPLQSPYVPPEGNVELNYGELIKNIKYLDIGKGPLYF